MKILKQKSIDTVIDRMAANYIIAADALKKADTTGELNISEFTDAVDQLTDNTLDIVETIGGTKGLMRVNKIIQQYFNKKV